MAIIYKITNKVNGKIYIGFTMKTLKDRWKSHCKHSRQKGNNRYLQRAIRKHGKDSFLIEILHEEPDSDHALNVLEPYYIAKFNSTDPDIGYNMTFGGEGGKQTEEVCRKKSEAMMGKNNPNYGKDFSGENNPMFGRHHSDETKRKQSEAKKNGKFVPWNKGIKWKKRRRGRQIGQVPWNKGIKWKKGRKKNSSLATYTLPFD